MNYTLSCNQFVTTIEEILFKLSLRHCSREPTDLFQLRVSSKSNATPLGEFKGGPLAHMEKNDISLNNIEIDRRCSRISRNDRDAKIHARLPSLSLDLRRSVRTLKRTFHDVAILLLNRWMFLTPFCHSVHPNILPAAFLGIPKGLPSLTNDNAKCRPRIHAPVAAW